MSLFLVVALTTPVAAAPLALLGTVAAPPTAHDLGSFRAAVPDLPVVMAGCRRWHPLRWCRP